MLATRWLSREGGWALRFCAAPDESPGGEAKLYSGDSAQKQLKEQGTDLQTMGTERGLGCLQTQELPLSQWAMACGRASGQRSRCHCWTGKLWAWGRDTFETELG
jgi:hypothetical protein